MIRCFDIILSFFGLFVLSPLLIFIYLLVILESRGGGIYSQSRVGRNGSDFELLKFRSMKVGADKMGLITVGSRDPRMTRVGFFIRKYKLDELPQLINVLKGDMSLVGPRPEVRKYVNLYNSEQIKVLSVRPGLTDYASIKYVDEADFLSSTSDPEKLYIDKIMPDKLRLNLHFINNYSVKEYFKLIFITIKRVFFR